MVWYYCMDAEQTNSENEKWKDMLSCGNFVLPHSAIYCFLVHLLVTYLDIYPIGNIFNLRLIWHTFVFHFLFEPVLVCFFVSLWMMAYFWHIFTWQQSDMHTLICICILVMIWVFVTIALLVTYLGITIMAKCYNACSCSCISNTICVVVFLNTLYVVF